MNSLGLVVVEASAELVANELVDRCDVLFFFRGSFDLTRVRAVLLISCPARN